MYHQLLALGLLVLGIWGGDSMNEGANGAISECVSYLEQGPSELACSVSCGTVFYCSVDGLSKNFKALGGFGLGAPEFLLVPEIQTCRMRKFLCHASVL